jgi:hypothetical protein
MSEDDSETGQPATVDPPMPAKDDDGNVVTYPSDPE